MLHHDSYLSFFDASFVQLLGFAVESHDKQAAGHGM